MRTLHIFISGFVQGVGYRQFVKKNAQKLGITGWVTNLPDGRVEALLQSQSQQELDQLIQLCKKGPFLSEVRELHVSINEEKEQYSDFRIIA